MPISQRTHDEKTGSGSPLFLVITENEEFEGQRYGVHFRNGVARTKHPLKALWFAESLGYEVQLHEDMPSSIIVIADAPLPPSSPPEEIEDEEYNASDEEDDFAPEEDE